MKILFLVPYPLEESPSQRFRFEQYFGILKSNGIEFNCYCFWNKSTWPILYKNGHSLRKITGFAYGIIRRFFALTEVPRYSYVFIHRECAPIGPPIFEWIIAKIFKKRIIYDFDDAIWLTNTSEENKIVSQFKWHSKANLICRWSYKVSCGNEYLATYARRFSNHVVVNPTTIDTENMHNPTLYASQKKDRITIGWTGTHSTLKYLNQIVTVIQQIESKYQQVRFLIICNKSPDLPIRSMVFKPWSKKSEIKDLLEIDIGIMPLTDDLWAEGKCGFKALQFMALNIPSVASPVGVNKQIIQNNENGFLCTSNEEWLNTIEKLIEDEKIRKLIGANARKTVIQKYSVLSNSDNFLSLFT
jgi:glycosyltransferase involved in cell wall biosynthesis